MVTGVAPIASDPRTRSERRHDGYTSFVVTFDPNKQPNGSASGITNFTGTYSYLIAPDNGKCQGRSDGHRLADLVVNTTSQWGAVRVWRRGWTRTPTATSDENPLTTPFTGLTPGDAYVAPMPHPPHPSRSTAASILSPPFDQNTLPLIFPGPYVVSTSVPNGTGSDNVVNGTTTGHTNSSLNVTFDRPMQTSTFTPANVLQIMGPLGSISGPQSYPSDTPSRRSPPPPPQLPGRAAVDGDDPELRRHVQGR